jgi:hypothetical protein
VGESGGRRERRFEREGFEEGGGVELLGNGISTRLF